jgi:hypothetical protein
MFKASAPYVQKAVGFLVAGIVVLGTLALIVSLVAAALSEHVDQTVIIGF